MSENEKPAVEENRLEKRVAEECLRFGLPYDDPVLSFELLLTHIYANRELLIGQEKAWDKGFEAAVVRIEELGDDEEA